MNYEPNEMEVQCFQIDNDELAEWAVCKIKDAAEERDRLLALVESKRQDLALQEQDILNKYDNATAFLMGKLQQYMNTVKCKSTKTQDTYQLLSGKLVRKHPGVDYKIDNEKLLDWLKVNNRVGLIKTSESPMWGEIKKHLTVDPDSGFAMISETGEVVDGISVTATNEKFDIKF